LDGAAGRSYSLERFLGKLRRRGWKIERTGFAEIALATCGPTLAPQARKLWDAGRYLFNA
jgi:hypothetical protein